jgi:hypothetical protein
MFADNIIGPYSDNSFYGIPSQVGGEIAKLEELF